MIPLKWRNAFLSENDWNLSKYTVAQLCFLMLFSINYLVACSWAAFVQGQSITDTTKVHSYSSDIGYSWAYFILSFILTYVFIEVIQATRRKIFHLDLEDFERENDISTNEIENSEQKRTLDSSSHPVDLESTERKLNTSPRSSLRLELLTKAASPPLPTDWKANKRQVRTLWFDKMITYIGQAVMFLTAVSFHSAIQITLIRSDSEHLLSVWLYALCLALLSLPLKTFFILRLKRKQMKLKSERSLYTLKHHFLITTKLASWRWLTNYLQSFLSNIMALAFSHAIIFSIQLENLLGYITIPATWIYTFLLMICVVFLILQLEQQRRKIVSSNIDYETENLNLAHNFKVEFINLTENTAFFMAVFAIPYSMDLTTSFFSEAPNIAVLGVYAFLITIGASLFIIWVQYKLFCATWEQQLVNERRIEEAKEAKEKKMRDMEEKSNLESSSNSVEDESSASSLNTHSPFVLSSLSNPNVNTNTTNANSHSDLVITTPQQNTTRGFHKLIQHLHHDNIFLHFKVLLPNFLFWSQLSRICIQGMGLTVAYAWNTFFVELVILKQTNMTRWGLFGYAILMSSIAAFVTVLISRSDWLKNVHIRVYKPISSERLSINPENTSNQAQEDEKKFEKKGEEEREIIGEGIGIQEKINKDIGEKSHLIEEEHKRAKRKGSIEMNLPLAFETGTGYGYRNNQEF